MSQSSARAVHEALSTLRNPSNLTDLFCDTLNYEVRGAPLVTDAWTAKRASEPLLDGRIVASHEDFQVVYCRIPRLLLTTERPIVNQILRHVSPYSLVVFADEKNEYWHFVNVKYDEDAERRRVFRRITIGPDERLHTAAERIAMLEVVDEAISPLALQATHDEAFDVQPVTKEFYQKYNDLFSWTMDLIRPDHGQRETHAFTQQLFNRMMFLYFVQKLYWEDDGERHYWLNDDPFYMKSLFERYKGAARAEEFHSVWLEGLFFEAFRKRYGFQVQDLPQEVKNEYATMPWLNGGLFEKNEWDREGFSVRDIVFERLYNELLEHFNFTVREDTPVDIEVAVDPIMLGHVYESLIAEEERGRAGIFYTEATELDFMCRRALIEYLDGEVPLETEEIIRLVLDVVTPEEVTGYDATALAAVRDKLDEVKVVDPACGSGAFLVTMMNVMAQLHQFIARRLGQSVNLFELKKKIVADNLYGVDIKEWACRVAELRLWLSLIVETEGRYIDNMYLQPLLPNLDYKIRQGDSLVEEIEGQPLSLRGRFSTLSPRLAKRIGRFIRRKDDYFYNRDDRNAMIAELKRLEMQILWDVIDSKLQVVNGALGALESQAAAEFAKQLSFLGTGPHQPGLFEETDEARKRQDERKAELAADKSRLITAQESIGKKRERNYFLWDIDFAEVFQDRGGFDIVIGNPPYVRQEAIAPQNLLPDEITAEIKKEYKEQLVRSVQTLWGKELKVDRRSDLYLYFYFHGLGLLRPGGVFCFITSNSWLDVGYGACLQSFLLDRMKVKAIYDNLAKRSFAVSDINTVIVLVERPDPGEELEQHVAKFVAFRKPFEDVVTVDSLSAIYTASEGITTDHYRMRAVSQGKLFLEGLATEPEVDGGELDLAALRSIYVGSKWGGKYIRAPDIFFSILERSSGRTRPLGDFLRGERYLNTGGADGFFIITKFSATADQRFYEITNVSKEGRKNGSPTFLVEREFARPAVKSTDIPSLWLREPDALVLDIPTDPRRVQGTKALEYIRWGEQVGFHKRSVTRTQKPWWKAPRQARRSGPLLWMRGHHAVHKAFYNPELLIAVRFYRFYPHDDSHVVPLAAILNSTYFALFKEVYGSTKLGLGALDTTMADMKRVPIPFPGSVSYRDALEKAFNDLATRRVLPVAEERQLPDRQALDEVVFDMLGLTPSETRAVYDGVVSMVRARLDKARSV